MPYFSHFDCIRKYQGRNRKRKRRKLVKKVKWFAILYHYLRSCDTFLIQGECSWLKYKPFVILVGIYLMQKDKTGFCCAKREKKMMYVCSKHSRFSQSNWNIMLQWQYTYFMVVIGSVFVDFYIWSFNMKKKKNLEVNYLIYKYGCTIQGTLCLVRFSCRIIIDRKHSQIHTPIHKLPSSYKHGFVFQIEEFLSTGICPPYKRRNFNLTIISLTTRYWI